MTTVINLWGGPSSGKSTLAAGIFHELKSKGIECELAREYAKDVVWEGRTHLLENQLYLFAKQAKRIKDLIDKVEFVITDSPILMGYVYLSKTSATEEYKEALKTVMILEHNSMQHMDVLVPRLKPYSNAGRTQTEKEARALDIDIIDLWNTNGSDLFIAGKDPKEFCKEVLYICYN